MRRLWALLLALPSVGCAYMGDRGADFADCFRFEGSVGVGVQANVAVGELFHLGVGSSRRWSAGWRYGAATTEKRVEDHFPLSYVWTLVAPDTESLHSLRIGEDAKTSQHRCYIVLPGELNRSLWKKDPLHYYDIEVGVMAAILGAQVGFSPGEFVDWLLGWFGADIAGDDGDRRAKKRLYRPIPVLQDAKGPDPPTP